MSCLLPADKGQKDKTGFNSCQFGKLSERWETYYAAIPSHMYDKESHCGLCIRVRGTEKGAPGQWVKVRGERRGTEGPMGGRLVAAGRGNRRPLHSNRPHSLGVPLPAPPCSS